MKLLNLIIKVVLFLTTSLNLVSTIYELKKITLNLNSSLNYSITSIRLLNYVDEELFYLTFGTREGKIIIWEMSSFFYNDDVTERNIMKRVLNGHTQGVRSLVKLRNGSLASGSDDTTIRIWDINGRTLKILEGHTGGVSSLVLLPDGSLASGSYDRTIRRWDIEEKTPIKVQDVYSIGGGYGGSFGRTMPRWYIEKKTPIKTFNKLAGHTEGVSSLVLLPDGSLASGSYDKIIRIWETFKGEIIKVLNGHTDWVSSLVVLPDGSLVSASYDKTIRIWNTITAVTIKTLTGHTDWVSSLVVLKDGSLVSASYDKTIIIWNTNTGNKIITFTDHNAAVILLDESWFEYIEYNENRKNIFNLLVSSSVNGKMIIWKLERKVINDRKILLIIWIVILISIFILLIILASIKNLNVFINYKNDRNLFSNHVFLMISSKND
jgi:WD40 repeat protein